MAISLPNGALVAIASGYGAATNITAITNANPGVASASNTLLDGAFVEVTSGWSRLDKKIVRVNAPTTTTFELEGINTTSTITYPAGSGTGSFREISGWTQLSQILSSSSSGGDQQFTTYQFLESDVEKEIPTTKSPIKVELSIADDPTLAGYILASTANDDRLPRAVRVTLPNGAIILYNAYVSLNKTPSLTVNEVMASKITLSLLNEVVRYAS